MHLTTFFTTLISFLLIDPTTAWTLTIWPSTQDCSGPAYTKYESSNTSPQCFTAGRPGEDVTCQTTTDDGKTWTDCADDASAAKPADLSFKIGDGNYCAFAAEGLEGCAGRSMQSEGQCVKGGDYGSGLEMRFQCED